MLKVSSTVSYKITRVTSHKECQLCQERRLLGFSASKTNNTFCVCVLHLWQTLCVLKSHLKGKCSLLSPLCCRWRTGVWVIMVHYRRGTFHCYIWSCVVSGDKRTSVFISIRRKNTWLEPLKSALSFCHWLRPSGPNKVFFPLNQQLLEITREHSFSIYLCFAFGVKLNMFVWLFWVCSVITEQSFNTTL